MLCELASSEKDRRLIKYAVCTSSQLSATSAKNLYGMSDLAMLQKEVTQALDESQEIRKVVTKIASMERSVALERLGVVASDSDENSDSSSDNEESTDDLTDNDANSENNKYLKDDRAVLREYWREWQESSRRISTY